MPRFFVPEIIAEKASWLELSADDAHHIIHVLRLRQGAEITVCDGSHTLYICSLDRLPVPGEDFSVKILERSKGQSELPFFISLYQGIPKGDKMGTIVRMAVELGVGAVVPVLCDRSISRPEGQKGKDKARRWQKVAMAAAKQSGRDLVPAVSEPVRFEEALKQLRGRLEQPGMGSTGVALTEPVTSVRTGAHLAFVPYEGEGDLSLRSWLEKSLQDLPELGVSEVSFFIGPEGGFSGAEVEALTAAGVATVSLGNRILRTETAAAAVLAMLSYELEMA